MNAQRHETASPTQKIFVFLNLSPFLINMYVFYVNCNLKTISKKWKKSLKLIHLHENGYYTLVISKVQ